MSEARKVFIAWSKETEAAAAAVKHHLEAAKLPAFMSHDIIVGKPFRQEIRRAIRDAYLVVSIFPQQPSPWQIAEAGQAYFENKLLPVCLHGKETIDPFSAVETLHLLPEHASQQGGASMDKLVAVIEERIAGANQPVTFRLLSTLNRLFFYFVPVFGILAEVVLHLLLALGIFSNEALLQGAHVVSGSVVYGGSIFVALVMARAGVSLTYSEHRFGFRTGRKLFTIWFIVALLQLIAGVYLGYRLFGFYWPPWLGLTVMLYLLALILGLLGIQAFSSAYRKVTDSEPLITIQKRIFTGNVCFVAMVTLFSLVILLMKVGNVGFLAMAPGEPLPLILPDDIAE